MNGQDDREWVVTVRVKAPGVCEKAHVESGVRDSITEGLDSFTVLDVEAVLT